MPAEPSTRERALALRAEGLTGHAIAKRLGVSPQRVYQILATPGASSRPGRRCHPRAADMVAAYLAGASSEAVARRYGSDRRTVLTHVRRAGHPVRKRGPHTSTPTGA